MITMRNRVQWQSNTGSNRPRSGTGQVNPNWISNGNYYASMIPISGGENVSADRENASTLYTVTMRNVGNITPQDRLIDEASGIILNILSVVRVNGMNGYLELSCKA